MGAMDDGRGARVRRAQTASVNRPHAERHAHVAGPARGALMAEFTGEVQGRGPRA